MKNIMKNMKRVLFIFITLVIFYFLFRKVSVRAVVDVFSKANLFYLVLGILLTVLLPIVMAERWRVIIKTLDYDVSFRRCFSVIMGVWPLHAFTPSKSGDLAKAYFIKDKAPASKIVGSILTERLLDLLILTLFSLVGLLVLADFNYIIIPLLIFFGIIFLFFAVRLNIRLPIKDSWREKIGNVLLSMKLFTKHKKYFYFILFWTFMSWIISIVQTQLFFVALGADVSIIATMAYLPLAIFIGLIPITLGGMGTREGAIIYLFSNFATASQSLGAGLLYSFTGYWILSIAGIPFMKKEFE